jgi:hypothetical protein
VCLGACQPRAHPFSDALALELGDGAEDVKLQSAGWCRRVYAFVQGDEADTNGR